MTTRKRSVRSIKMPLLHREWSVLNSIKSLVISDVSPCSYYTQIFELSEDITG